MSELFLYSKRAIDTKFKIKKPITFGAPILKIFSKLI